MNHNRDRAWHRMPHPEPSPATSRWHHAASWLDDLAIVTWAVEPDSLAAHLPDGWVPLTWPRDGREVGLASLVAFRDRDFRFNFWPWTRLSCGQVNYRAYVRHGDETGVWFFGTSLDSPLVAIPRALWRMPWYRDHLHIEASWQDRRLRRYALRATGDWGAAHVDLVGADGPVGEPPVSGMDLGADVSPILIDPETGWYRGTDGRLGRYGVTHPPMAMAPARVVSAHSAVFDRLGLVDPSDVPIDARVVREIRFDILTPPRRLPGT